MKTLVLRVCALFVGCVAIAACSQTTELSRFQYTPNVVSVPNHRAGPLSYRVLHSFGADHDGYYPVSGLIDGGDTFYGTTSGGGLYDKGTVYSVTTSGAEKVVHSFGKAIKGIGPYARLIDVGGTLYGTTAYGGAFGDGTVFSMTRDGSEKVLHRFGKGADGKYPSSVLIEVGGTLYGTTGSGGSNYCFATEGCGTVFSITTGGKEKVLHSFGKGTDGRGPQTGLIDVRGTLYGTTYHGGTYYYGTIFSITTGGRERVLHGFGNGSDGAIPEGELIDVKGTLYGTTESGGTHHNSGTVFSITRAGSERVLHSFGKGIDGNFPYGGLIDVGGVLYGTTVSGGTNYCPGTEGCGTVFSITTGGTEKVLRNFGKGTDGNGPLGTLIYDGGSLFGVTQAGGAYANKRVIGGTVFSLTP
jgi:uncharacterized repeat protein (TIGR03803 family)